MTTFYAIFRMRNRVASTTLLHYTTLKAAAAFMRSNGLVKIGETHFSSHGLVQWEVQ